MKYQYQLHNKQLAYNGFFTFNKYTVSFEKFEGGFIKNVDRECSRKGDIVAVIPYDPVTQTILMVEQFRIGMMVRDKHPWTQEIVAGFMDPGEENQITTAQRELTEETGCVARAIYPLIEYYPSPGGSAAKNHLFVAIVDSKKADTYAGLEEEGENIRINHINVETIKENLQRGLIDNATSLIAFHQFFLQQWHTKKYDKN